MSLPYSNEKPAAFPAKDAPARRSACPLTWEQVQENLMRLASWVTYGAGVAGAVRTLWDLAHQLGLWR